MCWWEPAARAIAASTRSSCSPPSAAAASMRFTCTSLDPDRGGDQQKSAFPAGVRTDVVRNRGQVDPVAAALALMNPRVTGLGEPATKPRMSRSAAASVVYLPLAHARNASGVLVIIIWAACPGCDQCSGGGVPGLVGAAVPAEPATAHEIITPRHPQRTHRLGAPRLRRPDQSGSSGGRLRRCRAVRR